MKPQQKKQSIKKDKTISKKKVKTAEQPINKKSSQQKQKIIQVTKQKDNKSFIQKFKDKHSIISKQGLLKLFEKQTFKSNNNKQQQVTKQAAKPSYNIQSPELKDKTNKNSKLSLNTKQKSLERIKIQQIIKARSHRKKSQASVTKSVQLPQLNPKLVKIQKSISTTVHLREKLVQSPIIKAHTDSISRQVKKVSSSDLISRSKLDSYNFQLDKFALDHLDFLDRFQERIRKRQLTPSF